MFSALSPPPSVLGTLGADLAALRPTPGLAEALRCVPTIPRIVESEAFAGIDRTFAGLRQAAETMRAMTTIPTFNLEH